MGGRNGAGPHGGGYHRHHNQYHQPVCRHYARQKCNYGDTCRFSHDPALVAAYLANEGKQGYGHTPQQHHRRLVVAGLPPAWTASDVGAYFTQFGTVNECKLVAPGKALLSYQNTKNAEEVVANVQHLPPVQGIFKLQACFEDQQAQHTHAPAPQLGGGLMDVVHMLQTQQPDVLTSLRDQLLELVSKEQRAGTKVAYVLLKASAYDDLVQSVEHGMWHVDQSLVGRINELFNSCEKVIIIFSVRGRNHYSGYAELTSQAANRSSLTQHTTNLPLAWEHIIGVRWVAVGKIDFASLPSILATNMPDGHFLPVQDGEAICKEIYNAPETREVPNTEEFDITALGYDEYLSIYETKRKEIGSGTPAD
eukprot:TRINITY_DN6785_c0_g1_i3.p1 TRINITY_DN6785_c0_g1~~TRINITY_DN6785_c0_g1_i3.p1  ORF type:complete len:381 (+),score=52.29 TRINITY_DN6785_c0_g1_i3:49-1143(+)